MTDADEPSAAGKPRKPPGAWFTAVVTVAVVAQVLVLGLTGLAGLFSPISLTYILALAQTVGGFVVIYALAARRRRIVLLVPVASVALTVVIVMLGTLLAQAQACSAQGRSLAGELAAPPGVALDLRGRVDNLSWAQFSTDLNSEALIEHYRTEFDTHGWQIITGPGFIRGSGEGIAAVKDRSSSKSKSATSLAGHLATPPA